MSPRSFATLPIAAAFLLMTGCESLLLTAAGIGSNLAANHRMGGIVYHTFSEPLPRVRSALRVAFRGMAITGGSTENIVRGERIAATAGDRLIEVELEALTPATTRMRVVATMEGSLFVDGATALEIVRQTEKVVGRSQMARRAP